MACYCEKCKKTMDDKSFYTSNNTVKYPNGGKMSQCKNCITMHVDNWNPETYIWILEEADVPYIPDEWNRLMLKYAVDGEKVSGTTIMGRYLAKMKLTQWRKFRYKDSEFLQEMAKAKIEQAMSAQGYDAQDIAKIVNEAHVPLPDRVQPQANEEELNFIDVEDDSFKDELTDEDRAYLRIKWGKTYRPEEWVQLEQLYEEMMNSYDIQAAGDINTLKIACKCSLKANQLLDLGDIEGAQKATKMYDNLMKSGKWTAAQIKSENEDLVDSVGELVLICEKDGFIPKYYAAGPQDYVDRTIEDLQKYTFDLIQGETNLNEIIETAFKMLQDEQERIKEAAESEQNEEENFEDKLFDYDNSSKIIGYDEYNEFADLEEELKAEDELLLKSFLEEEEDE